MANKDGTNGKDGGKDGREKDNKFSLANCRETTPAPTGLGTWAAKLKQAACEAISPDDVSAIVGKQVEKAKAGDPNAVKFVMGFVQGADQAEQQRERQASRERDCDDAERVRVIESADPPKPVAIDSPGAKQVRRLVGLYLAQNHNARIAEMERVLEIPAEQLRAVLNHEWFADKAGVYGLSPEGNQQCK